MEGGQKLHVNRLCVQTHFTFDSTAAPEKGTWEAPSIEHKVIDTETLRNQRYPMHNRRPPDSLTQGRAMAGRGSAPRLLTVFN